MGAGTIAALVGLIAAAVLLKGNVPFWLGGCCLLTLIIGAGGFVLARSARKNDDTFGVSWRPVIFCAPFRSFFTCCCF